MITKRSGSSPALFRAASLATALVLVSGTAFAQNQAQPPVESAQASDSGAVAPLRLEIVLLRRDAKKVAISRMPYVFSLSSFSACRLRMGAQVPIATIPNIAPNGPVQYREIGTNIDCSVRPVSGGRYQITISIEETSVLGQDVIEPSAAAKFGDMPIFRSYQSTNTVVLRNTESAQFTAAADRVTGETVSAEVTLTVLK
jgi:hypothetical protein